MIVRRASADDVPALAALHDESFGDARWSERQIADSLALATSYAWVAADEGAVTPAALRDDSPQKRPDSLPLVGREFSLPNQLIFGAIGISGFILCQITSDEAEILTFCVSPAARRYGAGWALLATAIASSREKGATRIFLEVASDNQAALALYRQAGFRVIGTRPAYYQHGDQAVDAVMMELEI